MTEDSVAVTGVILGGGRSFRMGGFDKKLTLLLGKPLLQWVIDAASSQVGQLLINAPGASELSSFQLPLVPDRVPGYQGPLMGLYSAMYWSEQHCNSQWLAVFACDTPFIPSTLISTLLAATDSDSTNIALVSTDGQLQPTASVWHLSLLPDIEKAVIAGRVAGFRQFLQQRSYSTVDWPEAELWRFHNINTPEDLAAAETLAQAHRSC